MALRTRIGCVVLLVSVLFFTSCTGRAVVINNPPPAVKPVIEDSKESYKAYETEVETIPEEVLTEQPSQPQIPPEPEIKKLKPVMSFLPLSNYDLPQEKVYYKDRVVVLTYHHISTKPLSSITIKPGRFEADLKMLKEDNFNVISLRDAIESISGNANLPPNAVVITFDDGYKSFYEHAYPLLKKYNMPATSFVITSWTEGLYPLNKNFDSLKPDEIREMYESGLVDIQSHSHFGHDYIIRNEKGQQGGFLAFQKYDPSTNSYEKEEDYKKRVSDDLARSISIIEKYTDNAPDILCFPFGHFNQRLVNIAKDAGFRYFVTTMYGNNKQGSKSKYIYRIRSGDAKLTSQKLKQNIIDCGIGKQPATP